MDNESLVTVIIPVYNCERYLGGAINSVLSQDCRPIEIVVVDDGSTDASGAIAKGYESASVRYSYQPKAGLAAVRNRGVELASGAFLAFLDSDDMWVSGKLSLQMAALESDPGLDMVFGHVQQFWSPELDPALWAGVLDGRETLPGHCAGTMLIRRDAFARVGPFDIDLRIGEFVDWYTRAIDEGLKGAMAPDVVMRRRIHENNMGVRDRDSRGDYLRILKRTLDRRRERTS